MAHGPRYETYVALLLNTAVWTAESASSVVGPWNDALTAPTIMAPGNGSIGYAPEFSLTFMRTPSSTPSLVTAASSSAISSRACPPVAMCSSRSSIHLTGRFRSRLATATATSSRKTPFFRPKPPPTSSERVRICSIGMPSCGARSKRTMCGDWVAV